MRKEAVIIVLMLAGLAGVNAATAPATGALVRAAKVVMRCDAPAEFSDRHRYAGLEVIRGLPADDRLQLSLLRKADSRYDILAGNDSLAAMGKLSGIQDEGNPVHLVLDTVSSGVEHFLFVQKPDGSGELLWSSATASALTTCTAAG